MRKGLIALAVAVLLVSFVSPFSYLPNPLGIVYSLVGGYSYDPRMPLLVNRFVLLRGNVEVALSAKLDGLLGTTGLDPLDPNQPLQGYEIEAVTYGAGDWGHGTVRLVYADGSSRRYRIPVVQSSQSWGRPGGWAYTGLDRYYAAHRELPHLPFPGPADAPVRLGVPERLPLGEETHQLGTGPLLGWHTSWPRSEEDMAWAPGGDAFLLSAYSDPWHREDSLQVWLVHLDGKPAVRLATDAWRPAWSGDGRSVAFLRRVRSADLSKGPVWDVVAVRPDGSSEKVLGRTGLPARPAVVGDSVWYLAEGALWHTNLTGAGPVRAADLPGLARGSWGHVPFALSPDAGRLAYRCVDALCLMDVDGQDPVRVDLGAPPRAPTPTPEPRVGVPGPAPTATLPTSTPLPRAASESPIFARLDLAWSLAGDRLAAVASDYSQGAMPTLWVVDRGGGVLQRTIVGPNGLAHAPQWTPDGRWVFLNTFPEAGRRIVAVEVASGRVFDLSQPHWDTLISLAPDGRRLLLWNGRGGFWTVPLELHTGE